MRTNIDIDADLLAEAMVATGLPTKKATVEEALRRMVRLHQRKRAMRLRRQKIAGDAMAGMGWNGNLETMRESWSS